MLNKEMNFTSSSPNDLRHSNYFMDKLNQLIRYARIVCPSKYEGAIDKYVTPVKTATRKVGRLPESVVRKRTAIKIIWEGTINSSFDRRLTKMTEVPYNGSNGITCTLSLQS